MAKLNVKFGKVEKAKPKTLYVYRPVENAEDIIAWAKSQGFASTLSASDMHVTVMFSKKEINWAKLGDDWCADDPRPLQEGERRYESELTSWNADGKTQRKIEGGPREVKALGDKGAVVLAFQSASLTERWAQFLRIGCSWDYEAYGAHVTISYKGAGVDLAKVEPYKGAIILGEETWEEIKSGAGDDVAEVATDVSKSIGDLTARLAAVEAKTQSQEAA